MTGRAAFLIGTVTAAAAAIACLLNGHASAAALAAFYAGALTGWAAAIRRPAETPAPPAPRTNWTKEVDELAGRCGLAGKLGIGVKMDAENAGKLSRVLKEMAAELDARGER